MSIVYSESVNIILILDDLIIKGSGGAIYCVHSNPSNNNCSTIKQNIITNETL